LAARERALRVHANKIASVTRRLGLGRDLILSSTVHLREGAVLAGRVLGNKSVYNQLEDVYGRFTTLHADDLIVGALGHRSALHGYEGVLPECVEVGSRVDLLNLGGVLGQCVSHNPRVGRPFGVEVLGQVLRYPTFGSRQGEPAFVDDGALKGFGPLPTCPVVYVAGTCMNSGKTAAACALVRRLTAAGLRVGGAKLTGVSLLRDALAMKDYGALHAFDFTDAGYVSTDAAVAPEAARRIFAALGQQRVQVIVAEMGDGILGEYGVQAILEDPELARLPCAFVLCANDPVGAQGGLRLLREGYGVSVDVVSGPATDNRVGTRYVEQHLDVPAINARTDPNGLGERVLERVQATRGRGPQRDDRTHRE